jgi:NADPH-dependent glutamate synthase beta subunit-like oxidoreductase/coenzyme F420-reducing hydrogenase beta subunit
MSFQLLKENVIDKGLCQGCGLCSGLCKNIDYIEGRPVLIERCHVEKGNFCGKCYLSCPQVNQKEIEIKKPLKILSLRSNDEKIRNSAQSGGFVTTLTKYLLDNKEVSHLVQINTKKGKPESTVLLDSSNIDRFTGVNYGRSSILKTLVETAQDTHETIGIVGVPCEIRGSAIYQKRIGEKLDIFKVGLFCNANIRNKDTDKGRLFAPCHSRCPADVDASGYIELIKKGKYAEALELIRENNPFPSVCGRICTNECEFSCVLQKYSNPIAIRELKRYVSEWEIRQKKEHNIENSSLKTEKIQKNNGDKIAIIGSGPAGLTAGYFLAKMGYRPTVFEKSNLIGGMLRLGIPQFRLPDKILDNDIEFIRNTGVEIKTNTPIDKNLTQFDLKKQGYKAFFYAIGQYEPWSLKIEGTELEGVEKALEFLLKWKYNQDRKENNIKGKSVAVIGGGSVAIDAAQTALRLGASNVKIIYRRSEEELPARKEDVDNAIKEGVKFEFLRSPKRFLGDNYGKIQKIELIKRELGDLDESNRCRSIEIKNSEYQEDIDHIIIAIGQGVYEEDIENACYEEINQNRGKIVIDKVSFETSVNETFAGGDMVDESKNVVITAIAHGKEVAYSIDRMLKGKELKNEREYQPKLFIDVRNEKPQKLSVHPEILKKEEYYMNFEDIFPEILEKDALNEAERCFNCNNYCSHCQDFVSQFSDISAGDIGSEKGFTSVIIWNKRGLQIVQNMIDEGLVTQGNVDIIQINEKIKEKAKRERYPFEISPREQIYHEIINEGSLSMEQISKNLSMDIKKVRYNTLRLVQDKLISMIIEKDSDEPFYTLYSEDLE